MKALGLEVDLSQAEEGSSYIAAVDEDGVYCEQIGMEICRQECAKRTNEKKEDN